MSQFGILQIKDRRFNVTDATLSGKLTSSGPIEWFLEVETDGREHDEDLWDPKAYIEKYPAAVRSMDQFVTAGIAIKDGAEFCEHTILPGHRLCCLYVLEHDYLDDNQLQFKKAGGNQLKMIWTAKCAVYWVTDHGEKLDVRIESLVDFLGFSVDAEEEGEARKLLTAKFEPRGFEFHTEPGRKGSFFLPIPGEW
jgi:hypothetical protein